MSTHKHIDKICCVIVCLAIIVTAVFMNMENLGAETADKVSMAYENLIFDTSRVHTVNIEMDNWDSFIETCTDENYVACNVEIDGERFENIAIRAKGNTSLSQVAQYGNYRYSFKIEFDQYDNAITYHGLDKLCLNNIIQDNTYMKDYLVYQTMYAFGVAAPLCSYVYVTVNGEDFGLYLAVEAVEESFLQRNFGNDYGDLYEPDSMDMGGGRGNGNDFDIDAFSEMFSQLEDGEMSMEDFLQNNPFGNTAPSNPGQESSQAQNTTSIFNAIAATFNQTNDVPQGKMPMGGQMPQGEMPTGENVQGFGGQMPEGMTPPNMGEKPGGDVPTSEATTAQSSTGSDEATSSSDTTTQAQSSQQAGNRFPDGNRPSMNMGGQGGFGGMGRDDVSLIYTDDNYSSYSNIFDNAKTNVTSEDKDRLISSIKKMNENAEIESVVDIEQVIHYFVVHNFALNFDSYTGSMIHNYYLYEKDGRMSMIPWDYNLAFGGFMSSSDATTLANYPIDSPVSGGTVDSRPMLAWIFENEEYTQLYHKFFSEFIDSFFENGKLEVMIESVKNMISPYVEKDPTKFCTYEEFEEGIDTLKDFCLLRCESIKAQLVGTIGTTSETQDKTTFIDASDINISAMGSMGNMGGGMSFGGGKGNRPDNLQNQSSDIPTDSTQANSNDDISTSNDTSEPTGKRQQGRTDMAQGSSSFVPIALSVLILAAGFAVVLRYQRRGKMKI